MSFAHNSWLVESILWQMNISLASLRWGLQQDWISWLVASMFSPTEIHDGLCQTWSGRTNENLSIFRWTVKRDVLERWSSILGGTSRPFPLVRCFCSNRVWARPWLWANDWVQSASHVLPSFTHHAVAPPLALRTGCSLHLVETCLYQTLDFPACVAFVRQTEYTIGGSFYFIKSLLAIPGWMAHFLFRQQLLPYCLDTSEGIAYNSDMLI